VLTEIAKVRVVLTEIARSQRRTDRNC